MPRVLRFDIVFAPEVLAHLDVIERRHHRLIRESIHEQLSLFPERATRNRKPLEQPAPFGATWEIRFGRNNEFRVFYEVDSDAHRVLILAIGIKDRSRLIIGGEEIEL
jgi:mRNA-degrading endonuclease RelE of RelBE toxin-antitoxin system